MKILRVALTQKPFVTLVSVEDSTVPSDTETEDTFFHHWVVLFLHQIPTTDKILLIGDFNAHMVLSHGIWRGEIGRHGVGCHHLTGVDLV